jgi:hypothetical protein
MLGPQAYAFRDISPQGPVHVLVIPRQKDGLSQLQHMREDQKGLVGHLLWVAKTVAMQEGLQKGIGSPFVSRVASVVMPVSRPDFGHGGPLTMPHASQATAW